jgi:DnaJ-class molecular chaperone
MSTRGRDFYAILGVPRDADSNTIKKAYRTLAMRWHPDKNPGNQEEAQSKFQEIAEAYEVLSDPEKRSIFDRYGEQGLRPGGGSDASRFQFRHAEDIFRAFFGGSGFGFGSPFEEMESGDGFTSHFSFGGMPGFGFRSGPRGPPRPQQMQPAIVGIACSLEQLFTGTTKDMRYHRMRNGTQDEVTLQVVIPAGAASGDEFKFPTEGDLQPGFLPQDVVFIVKERTHSRFTRAKDDLLVNLRVSLKESLCGLNRSLTGIDGKEIPVVVDKIFKPGEEIVIGGEGMTKKNGGRGDLRVKLDVVYPVRFEDELKEMLQALLPDLE